MSISDVTVYPHFATALACDYSLEILQHLQSRGMTVSELEGKLSGPSNHRMVCACLENLRVAGLLFRFRFGVTVQWWPNSKGISEVAARLAECAAMIPKHDFETVSELARQYDLIWQMTKFFEIIHRREILQKLRTGPAIISEINKNIETCVSENAVRNSLQKLEEYGLISTSQVSISHYILRGYQVTSYCITQKGVLTLDALQSRRSLYDIFHVDAPNGTS